MEKTLAELLTEVPKLSVWLTFSEAGERLGVTRQAVFGMVGRGELGLEDLRFVGGPKPIYLVRDSAVSSLSAHRVKAAVEREERKTSKPVPRPRPSPEDPPRQSDYVLVDPTSR